MLLEQSGELNFIQRWRLDRCVARDDGLRKFREDLLRISDASRGAAVPEDLNPRVLGEIRKAAAEQCSVQDGSWDAGQASWLRPAVAVVACMVIVTGIALINQFRPLSHEQRTAGTDSQVEPKWNDGIDRELASVGNMLASSFDVVDMGSGDADSIARELLNLEGTGQ